MRTTLDVDDDLMSALLEALPGRSKTGAIEAAIEAFLRQRSARRLVEMAGTVEIDDAAAELRRMDRTGAPSSR